eukprot:RCo009253
MASPQKKAETKAKEKKQKRKQDAAQEKMDNAFIKAANELKNPLEDFQAFQTFSRNDLKCTLRFFKADDLSPELREFTFQLVKANMETFYRECPAIGGWTDRLKREEMFDITGRFIIAFDGAEPVGFTSFRFDMDFGRRVVYCYELHCVPRVQGKGLGKHLMVLLELVARKQNFSNIVLTTFTANASAVRFFRNKVKFVEDVSNPQDSAIDLGFLIMGKELKPVAPASPPGPPAPTPTGPSS